MVFGLGARMGEKGIPAYHTGLDFQEELVDQLNDALQLPGVSNA